MNSDQEKSTDIFIVFYWKFHVSIGRRDLGPLFNSTCALVISITVVPDSLKFTLSTASKLWVFVFCFFLFYFGHAPLAMQDGSPTPGIEPWPLQ